MQIHLFYRPHITWKIRVIVTLPVKAIDYVIEDEIFYFAVLKHLDYYECLCPIKIVVLYSKVEFTSIWTGDHFHQILISLLLNLMSLISYPFPPITTHEKEGENYQAPNDNCSPKTARVKYLYRRPCDIKPQRLVLIIRFKLLSFSLNRVRVATKGINILITVCGKQSKIQVTGIKFDLVVPHVHIIEGHC